MNTNSFYHVYTTCQEFATCFAYIILSSLIKHCELGIIPNAEADIWKKMCYLSKVTKQISDRAQIETHVQLKLGILTTMTCFK